MEQDIVKAILNEIVQSVILMNDFLEKSSIKNTDYLIESKKYEEATFLESENDDEELKDSEEGRSQSSNEDFMVKSGTESSICISKISDLILQDSCVTKVNENYSGCNNTKFQVSKERESRSGIRKKLEELQKDIEQSTTTDVTLTSRTISIEEVQIKMEQEPAELLDSNSSNIESVRHTFESIDRVYDPAAIKPYDLECGHVEMKVNELGNSNEEFELLKMSAREGSSKECKPFMATNIEPSVIVIINNLYGSATSSDSDFDDAENSVDKSQFGDKAHKPYVGFKRISRRMSKQSLYRSSCRNETICLQTNIVAPSASKDIVPSVIVINDNLDDNAILLDSDFDDTKSSIYKSKSDYRISHLNSKINPYYNEEKIQIAQLSESPGNYRRRLRHLQENIEAPSTSTNCEPSVIVINDYSNESPMSTHSTGEMQRRTERDFAFLSDSDCSDAETCKRTLGYHNRAFEPSEEIELRNEAQLTSSSAMSALDSDLRSNDLYNSYVWSATGFLKVAQVICCITMFISISLCRFSSIYIQTYSIIGACFSSFLLLVYSYDVDVMFWKSYKIRLLLLEYVYLIIYTICETIFAIIKFEYDQEANDRERTVTMILMISTAIAGSTHCYDAIECYSFIEQAGKDNPEEKKLLLSFLPTCSQSSRAEICDIFHTCIL